jgi:hypothetical protein
MGTRNRMSVARCCCNTCNCNYEAADGNEWGPDPFDTLDSGWVAKWPAYDTFSAYNGRLINSAIANPNSGTWSALQRTASITPLGLKLIIESQVYSNPYSATTGIILTDGLSFRLFARWNLGGIGLYAFGTYYTFPNIAVQSGDKLSLKLCHTSGYQYKACYFRNETLVFEATGSYAFAATEKYGVVSTTGPGGTWPIINGTWDNFVCHIGNP